jgi:hypothetical protein
MGYCPVLPMKLAVKGLPFIYINLYNILKMKKGLISLERLEFEVLRDELNREEIKKKAVVIDDYFNVSIIKRSEIKCNQT